jgi:hypothetical protein
MCAEGAENKGVLDAENDDDCAVERTSIATEGAAGLLREGDARIFALLIPSYSMEVNGGQEFIV